ncbi:glycoprotease/Kae1 family metallohydrolase [Rhizoctonia solani 123E]|uniref:N(6)-L-threonylcarbamoyladenine synthase n=1 Tax=Rhizoctonia solani 123E TaxID=1423351 RepID=A0A074S209_9AGAM|nr:glycoprotease/Kae1 family metallohydrolase [Rhizoctonia solani 123E]
MLPNLYFHQGIRCFRPLSHQIRRFTVLAFETSADDTGVAIIDETRILSNVVVKQHAEHAEFRGIHPQVAIKAHDKNLPLALSTALEESKITMSSIDGIAFTRGPGMPGCLSIGAVAARALAAALNKPLVGVHHMQAHALTALYTSHPPPEFPFLTLLVSGGHTLLLLARSRSDFTILATTDDESIGNAFDRVARLLDVPWSNEHSAGASLERFAQGASNTNIHFSIPLPGKLVFSYSGLVSAVRSHILKHSDPKMVVKLPDLPPNPTMKHPPTPERELVRERMRLTVKRMSLDERRNIAASFQKAAIGQLEEKLKLGLKKCVRLGVEPRSIVVSGGVASNSYLRARLQGIVQGAETEPKPTLVFPPPHLCTDNAVMIAWTSLERFMLKDYDKLDIQVRPVWSIEDLKGKSSQSIAFNMSTLIS